jgi:hypothetical protein
MLDFFIHDHLATLAAINIHPTYDRTLEKEDVGTMLMLYFSRSIYNNLGKKESAIQKIPS